MIIIKKIYSITLSLAGICQSSYLVQQLSYSGQCDHQAFKTSLKSILEINPASLISIYSNHEKNLIIGLKTLISILTFSSFSYLYVELIKYIFDMMIIEKKLRRNKDQINSIQKCLLKICHEYRSDNSFNYIIHELAELYLNKISSLGSRILVKGTKHFLENYEIQKKIRCLLFSGIRSIVLWKQFGGNQLKLIFFRCHIIKEAKKILHDNLKKTI